MLSSREFFDRVFSHRKAQFGKRITRKIQVFASLETKRKTFVFKSFSLYQVIKILLDRMSLPAVLKFCDAYSARRFISMSRNDIHWCLDLIEKQNLNDTNCLQVSILSYALFKQQGFDPILKIGNHKGRWSKDIFKAHAWLTLDDQVVCGELDDLAHYKTLFTWPHTQSPNLNIKNAVKTSRSHGDQ